MCRDGHWETSGPRRRLAGLGMRQAPLQGIGAMAAPRAFAKPRAGALAPAEAGPLEAGEEWRPAHVIHDSPKAAHGPN